ncbi:hypothetical protein Tco_0972753 [Tanacetum coccineum]
MQNITNTMYLWICPIAYWLRLPEELSSLHDTFHVSNLKKYLADVNLHVLLDKIMIDKTLRFVEEPVEIMGREVKSFKCCTDISEITRKPSKTSKHGHENGRACKSRKPKIVRVGLEEAWEALKGLEASPNGYK